MTKTWPSGLNLTFLKIEVSCRHNEAVLFLFEKSAKFFYQVLTFE